MEAGEAAGGNKRGRQSAALYVVHQDVYPYLDLRVDRHANPLVELCYLFEESRQDYYQSLRQTMPAQCPRTRLTAIAKYLATPIRESSSLNRDERSHDALTSVGVNVVN